VLPGLVRPDHRVVGDRKAVPRIDRHDREDQRGVLLGVDCLTRLTLDVLRGTPVRDGCSAAPPAKR